MQDLDRHQYINSIDNLIKLENEYLPRVSVYSFSHKINESLPGIKEKIINYALNQSKTFLTDARAAEQTVGEGVIESIEQQKLSKHNDFYFDLNDLVDFSTMLTCHYVYSVLVIHKFLILVQFRIPW